MLIAGLWLDGSVWDNVAARLGARGHRAVPVTLPGQGDGNTPAMLADQWAAVVAAVDAAAGRPIVAGHSAACTLAWLAVGARPAKIGKIALIGGFPSPGETYFDGSPRDSPADAAHNHAGKERRVREGRAHAALVIDEDGSAQGWCQYGSPGELPGIKHKREYDKHPPPPPDWWITCLFVDKRHRGQGIARAALAGAPGQIAHLGGGLAEAISEVTAGRQAHGRFLFSATVELFEQNGFPASARSASTHISTITVRSMHPMNVRITS